MTRKHFNAAIDIICSIRHIEERMGALEAFLSFFTLFAPTFDKQRFIDAYYSKMNKEEVR